jgi:hypothetical protein
VLHSSIRVLAAGSAPLARSKVTAVDRAATPIALEDPEYVRMAATILGHASFATTERHYNQARSVEAAQHFQGAIGYLRAARKQKWCAR